MKLQCICLIFQTQHGLVSTPTCRQCVYKLNIPSLWKSQSAIFLITNCAGITADDKPQHLKGVNQREMKAEIGLLLFFPPGNRHIIGYWCLEANGFLPLRWSTFSSCCQPSQPPHRSCTPTSELLSCGTPRGQRGELRFQFH